MKLRIVSGWPLSKYTVQWAYAVDIGTPTVHSREAVARDAVVHLLGTWLYRNFEQFLSDPRVDHEKHPEFFASLMSVAPEIKRLIMEGRVWEAYALWEDFYIRFENEFGYPLYVVFGTVIVHGSQGTGLRNLIPLIERSDVSPSEKYLKEPFFMIHRLEEQTGKMLSDLMDVISKKAYLTDIQITMEQVTEAVESTQRKLIKKYPYMDEESERNYLADLREGVLRKLFPKASGTGLGALQRWLVQYADFGGAWSPGRHTNEGRAKEDARQYLTTLSHHLSSLASTEARVGRNAAFAMEADAIVARVRYLLDQELIWTAYLEYKEFEEGWSYDYNPKSPFLLQMAIGTMQVIPEPEAEPGP